LHVKAIQRGNDGIRIGSLAKIGKGKTPERAGLI
jgi:hypothetical protein